MDLPDVGDLFQGLLSRRNRRRLLTSGLCGLFLLGVISESTQNRVISVAIRRAMDKAQRRTSSAQDLLTKLFFIGPGIVNGGFESGLTGWNATGASSAVPGTGLTGTSSAQLGGPTGSRGDSSIAQTFTVPTHSTVLSFWYKPTCPDPVTEGWVTITLLDHASKVTTELPRTCVTSDYRQITTPVTGGARYTLTVTNHDGNVPGEGTVTHVDAVQLR